MRFMIGLLASLCVVELSPTLADEPPAPSTSASAQAAQQPSTPASQPATPAPAVTGSSPGATPTTQQAAASSTQAPAPAAAPASSDKPASTDAQTAERAEKALLAKGYKPEMRKGQKYYCRREAELGSRFEHKVCGTAADLEAITEASQEVTRKIHESGASPVGK